MTVGYVDTHTFRTTQGRVELPIIYHDASVLQAFFAVDGSRAAALLAGAGLIPLLTGGRALAGLVFFEYRDTSIGPYNEVGLALACRRAGEAVGTGILGDLLRTSINRKIGFYVVDLPVTTAAACAAGKEIWGFPKFVTSLPMEFGRGKFSATVTAPKSKTAICHFQGTYPIGVPLPGIDLVLYSNNEDALLKTVVTTKASMLTTLGRGLTLTVGNSKHRMAKNLHALGLDGARPFALQVTDKFRSSLPAGERLSGH